MKHKSESVQSASILSVQQEEFYICTHSCNHHSDHHIEHCHLLEYSPMPLDATSTLTSIITISFACFETSYTWNHTCIFFFPSTCWKDFPCCMYQFIFIAEYYNIIWTDHCLLILLLMDIWIIFSLGLFWLKLLQTDLCISFSAYRYSFILGIYLSADWVMRLPFHYL